MSTLTKQLQSVLDDKEKVIIRDAKQEFKIDQLLKDKEILVNLLGETGIRPEDRILLGYPNSYAFLVTYLAFLEFGATIVPVNPNMPRPELNKFIVRSQAKAAFFNQDQWESFKEHQTDRHVLNEIPLSHVFCITETSHAIPTKKYTKNEREERSYEDGLPEGLDFRCEDVLLPTKTYVAPEPSDEAIGVIMYTSGTTGKPKAVGLKHRHLLATAESIISSHHLTSNDLSFCFLPLFHINAQVVAFLSTLLSGGRLVIAEKFSASRFWSIVETHKITWVSAVPTILAILLKGEAPDTRPSSLRFIRSASAQLPKLHHEQFERKFGIPVIQSYGMTEAASQICVNPLPPEERRLGSVGIPVGVGLKITDDQGSRMGCREVGEIAIHGPGVVEYYEEAESQKDFRGGWFFTGDLGYVDEEGYVYITGRKKEMINRAGEKISPYEVEDVIRTYPGVNQVAVIGLPDPLYGERLAAYIQLTHSAKTKLGYHANMIENENSEKISTSVNLTDTEDRFVDGLKRHCQSAISAYKCPSEIHLVNTLPVGPTGKIQRTLLKTQIMSELVS